MKAELVKIKQKIAIKTLIGNTVIKSLNREKKKDIFICNLVLAFTASYYHLFHLALGL